jgi:hypothetical protein
MEDDMSYLTGDRASPFSLVYNVGSSYVTTGVRWNTSTESWVNTNVGVNGRGFSGRGFIWCSLPGNSGSAELLGYSVGGASEPQYSWGSCFKGNVTARSVSDDCSFSVGNSTEFRIKHSNLPQTALFSTLYSRCGIIRFAR